MDATERAGTDGRDTVMVERQHPDEPDVDAVFESIIARWDEVPDEVPGHERRQSTADVRDALRPRTPEPAPEVDPGPVPEAQRPVPWRVDPTGSVADALLSSDEDPGSAGDDEGYTPPPPRPLPPTTDRLFWGAFLGLVLGPLGLIWLVVVRPDVGAWAMWVVLGLTVGGFACLVVRQPPDRDDDPTRGAQV
jgi:hypothetical protein